MHRYGSRGARSSQELFSSDGSAWGYSAALLAALFTALALLCVRTLTVLGEPAHHAREAFHWGNLCGSLVLGLPRGWRPLEAFHMLEASRCVCSSCHGSGGASSSIFQCHHSLDSRWLTCEEGLAHANSKKDAAIMNHSSPKLDLQWSISHKCPKCVIHHPQNVVFSSRSKRNYLKMTNMSNMII